MDIIEKFYADVKRILKQDRLNNGGNYESLRASKAVAKHFSSCNKDIAPLANSIAEYWLETYIVNSATKEVEPSEKNITWLGAVLCLLEGDFFTNANDEEKNILSTNDWKELCSLVNYEAQDLPLDVLSSLMSVFTEKKVL